MTQWLPQLLARLPASVRAKLLVAFLGITGLLVTVSVVGLGVLGEANRQADELVLSIARSQPIVSSSTIPLGSCTMSLQPWHCRWSRATPA